MDGEDPDVGMLEQPPHTADQILARVRSHMQEALLELGELVARSHPGASEWQRKLARLMREVSGERGGRQLYGAAAAQLAPIGPVVGLDEWCDQMLAKIAQFREEYRASMAESPEHFPHEKTAADWSQDLAVFVPSQREPEC